MQRAVRYALVGGFSCTALMAPAVNAAALSYPPGRDHLRPGETIRIPLPGPAGAELAAELDGIDVSARLQVRNNTAVIAPAEQLAPGQHRVVLYALEGERLRELRAASFRVVRAKERPWKLSAQASLNARYLVDSHNPGVDANRWAADGAALVEGEWEGRGWSGDASANLLLNTARFDSSLDGTPLFSEDDEQRSFDLGDYVLNVRKGNVSGRLGHHALDYDSLVLSDFHRRGFSMQWKAADKRFAATGFGYHSTPITGIDNLSGIGSRDNRVVGAVLTTRPFGVGENATEFHLSWLRGRTDAAASASVIGDDFVSGGDAWSVAALSRALNERLELQAEYAESDFDFDGDGGATSVGDDAWRLAALYRPLRLDRAAGVSQSLELGLEYGHVGTFFRSLANPSLAADLDHARVHANYQRDGLSVNAALERQSDNTNDLSALPRIQTDAVSVDVNYTSLIPREEQPAWLGSPTYTLSWIQSRQKDVKRPAAYDFETDQWTRQITASASFVHQRWDWNLSVAQGLIEDNTDQVSDSRDLSAEVGFNFNPGERLRVSAQYQRTRSEALDADSVSNEDLATVDASLDIIPRKFTLGMSMSYNRRETDDVIEERSLITDANLTWVALEPATRRPGVALWLRGQHRDRSGALLAAGDEEITWQVLAGVTVDFATN